MKRFISLILVMVFVILAIPVQASDRGKYISYIAVTDGLGIDDPEDTLEEYGYTVIWTDLNLGTGGDDLLMGYKTTDDYSKAIKDVAVVVEDEQKRQAEWVGYRGLSQEAQGADFDDDLNEGAGGLFLWLVGTYKSSAGAPITDIYVKEGIDPPDDSGWEVVKYYKTDEAADINKNAGGAYLYLFIKRDNNYTGSIFAQNSLWMILVGTGVIIAAGVVTTVIVIKKKKEKKASAEAQ